MTGLADRYSCCRQPSCSSRRRQLRILHCQDQAFPPDRIISQALTDVEDVVDLFRANAHEIRSSRKQGGVTVHEGTLTQRGLTFLTAYDGQIFRPFLVNGPQGRPPMGCEICRLFKGRKELDLVWDSRQYLHGAHLYADGSILASFEYRGMARLDRCSRPVWLLDRSTHHSILPLADGSFWTPSVDREKNVPRPRLAKGHREDTLLHVSGHGKVLEEVNVIEAILKGGYQAILLHGDTLTPDPLHLNDIELVTEELAQKDPADQGGRFPHLAAKPGCACGHRPGDESSRLSMVGPFLGQHDPDIFGDGTLLVFDNKAWVKQSTPVRPHGPPGRT